MPKSSNPMNRPCKGKSLEYLSGDGVEMETWVCTKCEAVFDVPIEIDRKWSEAEEDFLLGIYVALSFSLGVCPLVFDCTSLSKSSHQTQEN